MIRAATAGDIGTIVALRALMFEAMGHSTEEVSDVLWQQDAARWLQLHLSNERTHVLVAEVNGTVVSCAIGQVVDLMPSPGRTGDGGMISNIATFPRHRRLGFTHAVVSVMLDWFTQDSQVEVVSLNATREGQRIYEHFGFAVSQFPEMRLRLDREEPSATE